MESKIKVIELFAGIGSQIQALKNIDIENESIGISEWKINSILAYDAIHSDDSIDYTLNLTKQDILNELKDFTFSNDGKTPYDISKLKDTKLRQLYNANKRSKNLGSIVDIKKIEKCDLLTYSFPCQDLSIAGNGLGIKKGTRSGLLFEVERLLKNSELPNILLMENVKNLLSNTHISSFNDWCDTLSELGYTNYHSVLNASDYSIPQERERVFMISILNNKIDYKFPIPIAKKLVLKDFINKDIKHSVNNTLLPFFDEKYSTNYKSNSGLIKVFDGESQGIFKSDFTNKRIYSYHGTSPTITCNNKINIKEIRGCINGDEALLLMGFKVEEIEKLNFLSDNEKYNLAGNSIVVNVLESIFKQLFI